MIGWRDERGQVHRGSLFAVFAALARGDAWSFPALRPHQREPWHAFTVQVAALALLRAGTDVLPGSEDAWRDLLYGLTPDQPEAWELVVDDWSKPALLQPPTKVPTDRAAYRNRLPTPDALDMLVTSKNHDLKQERMADASDEEWLFALVTLQTTEGFLGAGNYGVSRMNGGFANRMSFSVRPGTGGAGAAFRWDVSRVVAQALARPEGRRSLALLWTDPWDGTVSLGLGELDELYVEICRRIRLQRAPAGGIEALAAGSKVSRVAYKEVGGNTRDPWAPLTMDKKKESITFGKPVSVTAQASGFGYAQMSRLLDKERTTPSPLAHLSADEPTTGLSIVAAALVRGQGKTEGLHRRAIPFAAKTRRGQPPLDPVGTTAKKRAEEANEGSRRLRRALISLVQGGPDKARLDDDTAKKKTDPWIAQFDRAVDDAFFEPTFWAEVAEVPDNHRLLWRSQLRDLAFALFDSAAEAAPRTEVRRIRAKARARSLLFAEMAKWTKEVEHGE